MLLQKSSLLFQSLGLTSCSRKFLNFNLNRRVLFRKLRDFFLKFTDFLSLTCTGSRQLFQTLVHLLNLRRFFLKLLLIVFLHLFDFGLVLLILQLVGRLLGNKSLSTLFKLFLKFFGPLAHFVLVVLGLLRH